MPETAQQQKILHKKETSEMQSKLDCLFIKYKHFLLLLIMLPLQAWFVYCERTVKPLHIMYSRFDRYIPFVKEFVVPYLLWYVYLFGAVIYFGFVSKHDFYKLEAMLASGMAIACTIYMLFPNAQNLRPAITQNDIFSLMIKHIYAFDTPTDVAPSLHVYNSVVVHLSIIRSQKFRNNKRVKWASFISALTICASTVFIKQHSLVDVSWGLVLALLVFGVVYGLPELLPYKAVESANTL